MGQADSTLSTHHIEQLQLKENETEPEWKVFAEEEITTVDCSHVEISIAGYWMEENITRPCIASLITQSRISVGFRIVAFDKLVEDFFGQRIKIITVQDNELRSFIFHFFRNNLDENFSGRVKVAFAILSDASLLPQSLVHGINWRLDSCDECDGLNFSSVSDSATLGYALAKLHTIDTSWYIKHRENILQSNPIFLGASAKNRIWRFADHELSFPGILAHRSETYRHGFVKFGDILEISPICSRVVTSHGNICRLNIVKKNDTVRFFDCNHVGVLFAGYDIAVCALTVCPDNDHRRVFLGAYLEAINLPCSAALVEDLLFEVHVCLLLTHISPYTITAVKNWSQSRFDEETSAIAEFINAAREKENIAMRAAVIYSHSLLDVARRESAKLRWLRRRYLSAVDVGALVTCHRNLRLGAIPCDGVKVEGDDAPPVNNCGNDSTNGLQPSIPVAANSSPHACEPSTIASYSSPETSDTVALWAINADGTISPVNQHNDENSRGWVLGIDPCDGIVIITHHDDIENRIQLDMDALQLHPFCARVTGLKSPVGLPCPLLFTAIDPSSEYVSGRDEVDTGESTGIVCVGVQSIPPQKPVQAILAITNDINGDTAESIALIPCSREDSEASIGCLLQSAGTTRPSNWFVNSAALAATRGEPMVSMAESCIMHDEINFNTDSTAASSTSTPNYTPSTVSTSTSTLISTPNPNPTSSSNSTSSSTTTTISVTATATTAVSTTANAAATKTEGSIAPQLSPQLAVAMARTYEQLLPRFDAAGAYSQVQHRLVPQCLEIMTHIERHLQPNIELVLASAVGAFITRYEEALSQIHIDVHPHYSAALCNILSALCGQKGPQGPTSMNDSIGEQENGAHSRPDAACLRCSSTNIRALKLVQARAISALPLSLFPSCQPERKLFRRKTLAAGFADEAVAFLEDGKIRIADMPHCALACLDERYTLGSGCILNFGHWRHTQEFQWNSEDRTISPQRAPHAVLGMGRRGDGSEEDEETEEEEELVLVAKGSPTALHFMTCVNSLTTGIRNDLDPLVTARLDAEVHDMHRPSSPGVMERDDDAAGLTGPETDTEAEKDDSFCFPLLLKSHPGRALVVCEQPSDSATDRTANTGTASSSDSGEDHSYCVFQLGAIDQAIRITCRRKYEWYTDWGAQLCIGLPSSHSLRDSKATLEDIQERRDMKDFQIQKWIQQYAETDVRLSDGNLQIALSKLKTANFSRDEEEEREGLFSGSITYVGTWRDNADDRGFSSMGIPHPATGWGHSCNEDILDAFEIFHAALRAASLFVSYFGIQNGGETFWSLGENRAFERHGTISTGPSTPFGRAGQGMVPKGFSGRLDFVGGVLENCVYKVELGFGVEAEAESGDCSIA